MIERRFRRDVGSLGSIVAFVDTFMRDSGAGMDAAPDVQLVVEELFTNMVKYHAEAEDEVAIALDWMQPLLTIRLRAFGADRFDPTQPAAPPAAPAEGYAHGGRGLQIVRRIANTFDYDWTDRVSTITVTKRLER